jgi:uncharacterized membrane protein (UPF0127 family)
VRIINQTRGTELADGARFARSIWSRSVGLLGRASLRTGEGLVLDPCSSVHTAFMRFTIDLVYMDRDHRVVKVVPRLKPFRASGARRACRATIELPAGTIESTGTAPGDQLLLVS